MSAWFWLMLCFLVRSSEAQVNITAEPRQDVILPCRAPNNNKNIRAVEWNKPELDPDIVLVYRDGRLDPDNQHPSYKNRVDLQDRQMKDGDVSLVLKDVKMNDNGTYECRVSQEGAKGLMKDPIRIIHLLVLEPGDKDGVIEDGGDKVGGDKDGGDKDGEDKAGHSGDGRGKNGGNNNGIITGSVVSVILAVILLAVVSSILIYKRLKRQKSHLSVPPGEPAAIEKL